MPKRNNHRAARNTTQLPSPEVLANERRALEMRRAGASYDEIATAVGYGGRGPAHRAVYRALGRVVAPEVAALRELEGDRLDRMQLALWPKAMRGDVRSVEVLIKLMERRARLYGLDHADGIAERAQRLDEDRAVMVVQAITGILADLKLTPEQQGRVATVVPDRLRAITDVVQGDVVDEKESTK